MPRVFQAEVIDRSRAILGMPADWRDLFALTKPRVMTLVVFTGLCGLLAAPVAIDPVIGFIFTDVAHLDLEAHVPRITSFWETLLLGAKTYEGGAFHPHAALHAKVELRKGHFDAWLALWYATVDELFAGPRAEAAKAHAFRLGNAFRSRLAAHPSPADEPSGGITVRRYGA